LSEETPDIPEDIKQMAERIAKQGIAMVEGVQLNLDVLVTLLTDMQSQKPNQIVTVGHILDVYKTAMKKT